MRAEFVFSPPDIRIKLTAEGRTEAENFRRLNCAHLFAESLESESAYADKHILLLRKDPK